MGKRPSLKQLNPDDRFKDNDEDDEDELENQTEEPLQPDEMNKIQSRKKLIAKRRVQDTAPAATGFSFGGFGQTGTAATKLSMAVGSALNGAASEGEKPFAFTGFKGFSSYQPPASTAPATASNGSFKASAEPASSVVASSVAESTTLKEKTNGNSTNELAYKNITETELSFINGLEELYKRCYASNAKQRHYKLPIEVLNNSNIDSLGSEDDLKAKYAYLLAELNRNTAKWINKHVDESPLVILTPIFVDYFNYLILLEKQFFPEIFKTGAVAKVQTPATETTVAAGLPMPFSSGRGFEEKENNHGKLPPFKLNGSSSGGSGSGSVGGGGSEHTFNQPSSTLFFGKSNLGNAAESLLVKPGAAHLNGHNKSASVSSTSSSLTSSATMKIGDGDDDEADDDVQEIASDDAKLIESSKTFAALIKSSSSSSSDSSSKPLFGSSTDSSFAFKPLATDANKETTPASASTFKFGSTAPAASESFSLAQSTKLNFLTKPPSADTPALFTFGAKKEDKAEETPATKPPASASTFFSSFGANKEKEESEASGTFKPFSSFGGTGSSGFGANAGAPSLFSSLSKPQQASSDSAATAAKPATAAGTPFFSFTSAATAKVETPKPTGSIFGNLPAPGSGGIFGSIGTGGTSSIFAAANPLTGGGGGGGEGGEADDEPYEPPKPETSDMQEEGAVFTKRVKLFYFNGEKFCDRGIGNLYLKPTSNGEKTQLIVRADTKLATILLNIVLAKALPTSKIGAKDVSLLCVPNPPVQDAKVEANKPCKFLFKVKTEQDAEELAEKLNEYKK